MSFVVVRLFRREVLLPGVGFGDLLDDGVACAYEGEHVAAKEEGFGEQAEDGRGRGDAADLPRGHGADREFSRERGEVAWRPNSGARRRPRWCASRGSGGQ